MRTFILCSHFCIINLPVQFSEQTNLSKDLVVSLYQSKNRMKRRGDSRIIMVPTPKSVEELFREFKGRRAGLIRALTADSERLYRQCDPEKEALCLFGLPNETWELNEPIQTLPPNFPEPTLGINFERDKMSRTDWLSAIALHSDAWLLGVAFFFAGCCKFEKTARAILFEMINDLPTVDEVVSEAILVKNPSLAAENNDNNSNNNEKKRKADTQD